MEHNKILDKWLNGELSPKELEAFNTNPAFAIYHTIDRKVKDIQLPNHNTTKGFSALLALRTPSKKEVNVFSLSTVLKIAAILMLLLMSYTFVAHIPSTVTAPMANTEQLYLPDNSRITLNKKATVNYKKYGWAFDRNITLEGEAFFEVAKGKTFTVTTPQGKVTVLGTRFNVSTTNNSLTVSCYEGLVTVTRKNKITKVTPGNSYVFRNEHTKNNLVYTSHPTWINNESSFTNTDVYSVLLALENQFGIAIKTENINVDLPYTGTFTHKNLDDALRTVTVPLNLSYRKDSKNGVTIFNSRN